MPEPTRLIVGCGYLGQRVARRWLAEGSVVHCVTRSPERAEDWRSAGLQPIVADITQPETLAGLPATDTVLFTVGYQPGSGVTRESLYIGGLRNVLERLPSRPARIVLASSTGVYGDSGGEWVDEESPCRPTREAGRVLLAAEETLRRHSFASAGVVLRFSGLYGPQRIPKLSDLRTGRPIAAAEHGVLNLVHIDDATAAVVAAARGPVPRTYLIGDGHPVARREFYRHVAQLLGAPEPEFREPSENEAAEQRGGGNKRVSNRRMIAELRISLQYPTYREGLAAVFGASGNPGGE